MSCCFTVTVLLICLSIPATGIPLDFEEGPVGGRDGRGSFPGIFNQNISESGLPTFAEGPTEGRVRPRFSWSDPDPPVDNSEEVVNSAETFNSSAPDSSEIFEFQHGIVGRPSAPTDDREVENPQAEDTTASSNSDSRTGVTGRYQDHKDLTSVADSGTDNKEETLDATTSEPSQNINQESIRQTTSERGHDSFTGATTASIEVSSGGQSYEATTYASNKFEESPLEQYTTPGAPDDSADGLPEEQMEITTKESSGTSYITGTERPRSLENEPLTLPPMMSGELQTTVDDAIMEPRHENEVMRQVLQRLYSLEQRHKDFENQAIKSEISMSHEILLLKEALALEQNKTMQMAVQMTHMMEAVNDRLINISQKWTHPIMDLTNPMGAQGCRYSSFHRSGPVSQNATSTAWAPNDTEAEQYMVTGAACSASIGARAYLERRTVPSKPELMQFRCTCAESRESAVMRTCELHIWECLR